MDIVLKKKGASHGVKVPESKLTACSTIEAAPLPERIVIPLHQNIGAPCKATVKKGERVLSGQKIGDSESYVNAPVHATVSGKVVGTTMVVNPATSNLVDAIIIDSDGNDEWVELTPAKPQDLSPQEILGRIRQAGLVGLGGAAFPTHVKLSPPKGKHIDAVILNGCECEPYITADHRIMLESGPEVLSGLSIIMHVLQADAAYIAIEDNKKDAISHLEEAIAATGDTGRNISIAPLESKYPMGAEKVLTKLILGREVPIGGLPLDVGVVVQNVSTAKAIHDAVVEGRPFVDRVITVTGIVQQPKNLCVRFGTPIGDLIEYCGGITAETAQIILGGPMMGLSHCDTTFPTLKGTNAVLTKQPRPINEQNCISCGRCLDVCPMALMPTMLAKLAKAARYGKCNDFYIADCFECGACAYICPSNIPLVQYIKVAKKELAKKK